MSSRPRPSNDEANHPSNDWLIYRGFGPTHDGLRRLPNPPPWRDFSQASDRRLGPHHLATKYRPSPTEVEMVNAAIYLRRPLLVTGPPGTGKSTLAASIAYELGIGPILRWPITSRSTLAEGLYQYDAIGRLHEVNMIRGTGQAIRSELDDIGRFIRLGPLGTALVPRDSPRVLLIDEIDKADIDLPNDLLNVFEDGEFTIPELQRIPTDHPVQLFQSDGDQRVPVIRGVVRCSTFPIVIMTSNSEREFPPAFLRRCLRLEMERPDAQRLYEIAIAHLGHVDESDRIRIERFWESWQAGDEHATDQLLNALYLLSAGRLKPDPQRQAAADRILRPLDEPES